jgi:mRNA interferase HigB
MKVHLIKRNTILKYIKSNQNSKVYFDIWMNQLKSANWSNTNDIFNTFKSADILGKSSNRIVFNIGGNHYRLICNFYFGKENIHLFINWIGTHSEYTKLCDKNLQYKVNKY